MTTNKYVLSVLLVGGTFLSGNTVLANPAPFTHTQICVKGLNSLPPELQIGLKNLSKKLGHTSLIQFCVESTKSTIVKYRYSLCYDQIFCRIRCNAAFRLCTYPITASDSKWASCFVKFMVCADKKGI